MNAPLHIWITGASRGIGAAVAREVAKGNRCTLSGRDRDALELVANEFASDAVNVVPCDVAHHESVLEAHASAVASFQPFTETSIEEFDRQIATNLRGVFSCCGVVTPSMIDRKSGMIITINSIAARTTFASCSAYGASKAGALALTQVLRTELRQHGVKVCDVLVGATDTDIWDPSMRDQHAHRMLQGRDVAQTVAMLVSTFWNPRLLLEEVLVRPQHGDL